MGRAAIAAPLATSWPLLSCAGRRGPPSGTAGATQPSPTSGTAANGKIPSIAPSSEDSVRLAKGLRAQLVTGWGDPLRDSLQVGYNNDFLAFFPLPDPTEALLCVNFEAPQQVFVSGYADRTISKTRAQVEAEMDSVGIGILHLKRQQDGEWHLVPNSPRHHRITGRSSIPFAAGASVLGAREALGTVGNCAGGTTPWGTYLSCEENYDLFFGEIQYGRRRKRIHLTKEYFNWYHHYPRPPEHYGWVVEVDPHAGSAKKLIALGRFAHECATVTQSADKRAVVYSADDANDEHLYKFIASRPGSLEEGTLYVADTKAGRWLALDWQKTPRLRRKFLNQQEVLVRAREAAKILGATPLDRPEDIEICPRTGQVFIALTGNPDRGNPFGSILKIAEKNNNPLAMEFQASTFLTGGASSGADPSSGAKTGANVKAGGGAGFACPDNLAFDSRGNLWLTSDISGRQLNQPPFESFGNNGLFYIPMEGPAAGTPHLLATAPVHAEFTGPTFSPDGKSLFLSVQHPGDGTTDPARPTSHWPDGGKSTPRPAVIAISGPLLDTLLRA